MGYTRPEEIVRQHFIDSLRGCLGLRPLYKQHAQLPPFVEIQFGTCDHPAALVRPTTPVQAEVRFTIEDHYSRLSDGRRVGTIFREGARRLSAMRRLEREVKARGA
jgi:hypothetical protein